MFSGRETARLDTDRTGTDLDEWVEEGLASLGDVRVKSGGRIDIRPDRVSGDGLGSGFTEVSMGGRVRERKNGQVEVEVNFTVNIAAMGWVLGFLFIPLGIFILVSASQMQTTLSRRVRDALADMEDEGDEGD